VIDDRRRKWFDGIVWTAASVLFAMLADEAMAEASRFPVNNAAYQAECGSCHVAYPPALLGAATWREIMKGLDRHFGTDTSLAGPAQAQVKAYLEAGAGPTSRDVATLRISDASWFRREHDDVAAATWKSAAVKSAANCGACHRQADQGDFGERTLRVPGREAR
jgi:nitrate/TMAO reductase-like tetraheme cytochrome c subunit